MAERVKYDFARKRIGNRQYPWDVWSDGSIWRIKHGVDFSTKPTYMRNHIHVVARKRKMRCQTRILDGSIIFQFIPTRQP